MSKVLLQLFHLSGAGLSPCTIVSKRKRTKGKRTCRFQKMSNPNVKETPKKVYKSANAPYNTCRLCRSVGDVKYLKNLYNKANLQLLASAEMLYGEILPCDDVLPRLICRPCERRLNNFTKFKTLVCESQTSFVRTKRCSNISPSTPTTAAKSSKRIKKKPSSRLGLTFDDVSMSSAETRVS